MYSHIFTDVIYKIKYDLKSFIHALSMNVLNIKLLLRDEWNIRYRIKMWPDIENRETFKLGR